ncbi:MAG: glycosyltransferase family 4 protein [Planctomycetales bacterium]|nr:glycosyltransferase family 4 protein [Planctomycetales bacterium]
MKIATFWPTTPFTAGGAPRRFLELVDGLVERGHDVTLICGTEYTGQQTLRVERMDLPTGRLCSLRQSLNPRYRRQIAAILKRVAPQTAYCFKLADAGLFCGEARRLGIPTTLFVRSFELNIENNPNQRMLGAPLLGPLLRQGYAEVFRFFARMAFNRCNSIVFQHVEQHDKYVANRMLPKHYAGKISYLPNNSNPSWASEISPYKFPTEKVAVMAARLIWIKGYRVVFDALEQVVQKVPDARLVVLGDGPQEAEIREVAEKKNLPVEFMGQVKDVHAIVERARVLIYASFHEYGSPNVLLEGAVAGMPMLVADRGRHTVGDYPGVFPTEDSQALAELWKRAITDQSFTEALANASCQLADRYRFNWVEKAEELIRPAGL